MNRSGYTDDIDSYWGLIRYRGAVSSAIRGKRGQAFLRELLAILDAMPEKRLINGVLECDGEVCALGAYGRAKGLDIENLDPEEYDEMVRVFGIPQSLVREIMFENDDNFSCRTSPERRWQYMRNWVQSQIKESQSEPTNQRSEP